MRKDRHRADPQLVGGTERTDRDLTTIGNEHLPEHVALPPAQSAELFS